MRADRLINIVLLLQTRGKMTASALAEELGVARRTILRDVEALSLAGIPVYADGGHGGGIALDENYRTSLIGLSEAEARALFLSGSNHLLSQIGLGEAAESTPLKLLAALPARYQPSVDHMRQRIYIDPLWWWHDSAPLAFWAELQRAVYEDHCIHAVYENYQGEIVERELEPYGLVAKSSLWYLVARRDGNLRTYRVSRFHVVTVLERRFRRPPDFDLAAYWSEHLQEFAGGIADYPFTLRLREERLNFARWLTPGRCDALEATDESGWLTARFRLESLELARMLVFGLGADAQVLDPPELGAAVLAAAREILKRGDGN